MTDGKILACTGAVTPFATAVHFAAYAGVALRELSSGDAIRHRLSRGGDRQLNRALHAIALTQISMRTSSRRCFYDWKRSEGTSSKEVLRVLKQRLVHVVFRVLSDDHANRAAGPTGQLGTALISSAAGPHSIAGSSGKTFTVAAMENRTRTNT